MNYESNNTTINKVIRQDFKIGFQYDIFFTENMFDINNNILINVLNNHTNKKNKVLVFIDKRIIFLHRKLKKQIINYFSFFNDNVELVCKPILILAGEQLKNRYLFLKFFYSLIEKYKICRQSYIISIGGGSLQDFIGYVGSTAHRGIKFIRVPTTVLSQDDSGVGVKNGINYKNKKNFIGTFYVPNAVINDFTFLNSLNDDEFIEGFSEAIKVALINDGHLFYCIESNICNILLREKNVIANIIYRSAKLHAEHISKNGDPFEVLSSRPLDFGHWIAHKIESISNYKISHGRSVAIGVVVDSTYSYLVGFLPRKQWKKILLLFIRLNFKIYSFELSSFKDNYYQVFDGLEEFREHLGGKLTITLLKDIGSKIDIHHVNTVIYEKIIMLLKRIQNLVDIYDNK